MSTNLTISPQDVVPPHEQPLKDIDEWQDYKIEQIKKDQEVYHCETGKQEEEFRNYTDSKFHSRVERFYKAQHENQTMALVQAKHNTFLPPRRVQMSIWECLLELDSLVDDSDPDTDVSQLQHALMTAEAIRKKYPEEEYEWFWVVGLIHDLGKILSLKWGEEQWCVVGDTFPVGCRFSEGSVFPEYFQHNPDVDHPVYSTENGIYEPGCGVDNLLMSWGHDEYLYQVCVQSGCKLPKQGLAMIRFHSFYPWHQKGAYKHFMAPGDEELLKWVKEFNQFDLYSKGDEVLDVEATSEYYKKALSKYFSDQLWW